MERDNISRRPDAFISIETVHFVDREMEKSEKLYQAELTKLREVLFGKFDSEDKANDLAYSELQRRLDVLNHAHENMVRDRQMYLPRETYDRFTEEFKSWRDSVNNNLSNQAGRTAAYVTVLGIAFMVGQIIMHFWKQ